MYQHDPDVENKVFNWTLAKYITELFPYVFLVGINVSCHLIVLKNGKVTHLGFLDHF